MSQGMRVSKCKQSIDYSDRETIMARHHISEAMTGAEPVSLFKPSRPQIMSELHAGCARQEKERHRLHIRIEFGEGFKPEETPLGLSELVNRARIVPSAADGSRAPGANYRSESRAVSSPAFRLTMRFNYWRRKGGMDQDGLACRLSRAALRRVQLMTFPRVQDTSASAGLNSRLDPVQCRPLTVRLAGKTQRLP